MDLLSQHEAFLRAIFDAPDDDTPRLVYADFLQENGEEDRAAFVRYECALAGLAEDDPRRGPVAETVAELVRRRRYPHGPGASAAPDEWPWADGRTVRGFPRPPAPAVIPAEDLADPTRLRETVVRRTPEWYGARTVRVTAPPRLDAALLDALFALPFVRQATELDLGGQERNLPADTTFPTYIHSVLNEFVIEPVVTTAGVEALAQHKGARRLAALDLRNNNLDNDAARALVKSPYLDNLERLQLLEGNRFRGKVWQQVIERFGDDVVG
jgi:uncharacterized protein (TIGR02996 family)